MTDETPAGDDEARNLARSDGLASIAIMVLAVALLVFLVTRIV